MAQSRAPLHLGGPLGALGLGCVGGAVALAIMAINSEPLASETPGAAALPVDPPAPPAARLEDPLTPGAPRPGETGPGGPETGLLQAQAQEDAGGGVGQRPARAEGTEVYFIVRLKGAPEVDIITRNFKRDPDAASAAWNELVLRVPALADFTLAGASYSGEIKLAYLMPPGAPATPEDIRRVQERILGVEGVSYADPDFVAHPGKDTPP